MKNVKRIAIFLLLAVFMFSLTACSFGKKIVYSSYYESDYEDSGDADESSSSGKKTTKKQSGKKDEDSGDEDEDSDDNDSEDSKDSKDEKKTTSKTKKTTKKADTSKTTGSSDPDTSDDDVVDTDSTDYPRSSNPGALSTPMKNAKFDSKAEEMRKAIVNAKDTIKAKGTTYYVSNNGSDSNNGKSPDKAWKTVSRVASAAIQSGDAVLFERGSVFRTSAVLTLKSGVSYGAYGTGVKPCIYGSRKNYATAEWKSLGNNLWELKSAFTGDVGLIVFNHGEAYGRLKDSQSDLKNNYDFYVGSPSSMTTKVIVYLKKAPSTYWDIEIGEDRHILLGNGDNITIENLTLKYTGAHAFHAGSCKNVTIRNCEVGFCGGSYLLNAGTNSYVRYGNGIELMGTDVDILVENNWVYQIYDSGITHQGEGGGPKNFMVRNNLVEYCGMGCIEYWHVKGTPITNVTYEGNLLRFAGYGVGSQRPKLYQTACVESNGSYNEATNFVIKNNIFELSAYYVFDSSNSAKTPPTLSGNTFVQPKGRWLGSYNGDKVKFDDNVLTAIQNNWGDKTATVIFAD